MLDKTLYIFPTTRAIREFSNAQKEKNQFLPKLISIGDFFQRAIYTKSKTLISKELQFLYLQEVVQNIDIDKLGLSHSFSSFFKQSEFIIRLFNELSSEYKTLDDLEDVDTYALYQDHLAILKQIQKQYHNVLIQNNYIDQSLLPYHYDINQNFIKEYSSIKLFYDGYFSKFEFNIFQQIAQQVNTFVYVNINHYNLKNIKLFQNISIKLEVGYSYEIDLSNKTIVSKQPLKNYNKTLTITPISQRVTQIGFIKYHIYNMIHNHNISPNKIVVVLPDEKFCSLLSIFDDQKYFNFAMGNSIDNANIKLLVDSIVKLIVNFEPYDKDKFTKFGIDNELFEYLKKSWNRTINRSQLDEILEKIFLVEQNQDIQKQLVQIKISLMLLAFGSNQTIPLKLSEIFKLLQQKIAQITIDDICGGPITVMGLLETRGLNFNQNINYDGVIVCDFNDELVPKRSIKDKFISSAIKKHIDLPTNEDRQNLQRYYYKNLFDQTKYLAISYLEDEINTKSRFIDDIFASYTIDTNSYDDFFNQILYKSSTISHLNKQIILDIDLSKKVWSATSLKVYLDCPRKYYLKYILKIQEHIVSLKPKGYEIGNIIHKTIEKLTKEDILTYSNIQTQLNYYQKLNETNPYLIMDIELWKQKLKLFAQKEQSRRDQGIQIVQIEQDFNIVYNNINLTGQIDVITQNPDNSYDILDYKTSSSLKIDTSKTYPNSTDFQLEFYYLANRDKNINQVAYYDLNDASIKKEVMLEEKLDLLDEKLAQLHTKQVDFYQTKDIAKCLYCPYKIICNRDV